MQVRLMCYLYVDIFVIYDQQMFFHIPEKIGKCKSNLNASMVKSGKSTYEGEQKCQS